MDWCGRLLASSLLLIIAVSPAAACGFADCSDGTCAQRAAPEGAVRIACVGDSITAGALLGSREETYPAQLQRLLDEAHGEGAFSVTNLGLCGATMSKHTDFAYWDSPHYMALVAANWDYVVIMLGTNDALVRHGSFHPCEGWSGGAAPDDCRFANDYAAMIDVVRHLGTTSDGPKIYTAIPPPLMQDLSYRMEINQTVINDLLPNLIRRISEHAEEVSASIDAFTGLCGDPNWRATFPDGCQEGAPALSVCDFFCDSRICDQVHPNAAGYRQLASQVQSVLGLELDAGGPTRGGAPFAGPLSGTSSDGGVSDGAEGTGTEDSNASIPSLLRADGNSASGICLSKLVVALTVSFVSCHVAA